MYFQDENANEAWFYFCDRRQDTGVNEKSTDGRTVHTAACCRSCGGNECDGAGKAKRRPFVLSL